MSDPVVASGDRVGNYTIVSPLGTGGMGEVWLAKHAVLGHHVAIKLLKTAMSTDPVIAERFFEEARAATQIHDPGIVHVHDFGRHGENAYIVMEELVGESLATRLARLHVIAWPVAVRLVTQVALTMSVAHGHGIVHRDLKPDNLFVISDLAVLGGERIKILDFGVAKLLAEDTSLTSAGALIGTPLYMSPEQCRDAGTVDHRTDIYALGVVLFHLTCGRPPFVRGSSVELITAQLFDDPPLPSTLNATIPPALDVVISRCLAKRASDRYASMGELATALGEVAGTPVAVAPIGPRTSSPPLAFAATAHRNGEGTPTLATGPGQTAAIPPTPLRRWAPLAIVGGVAAAVVGGVLVTRDPDPGADPAPSRAPETAERDAMIVAPDTPPDVAVDAMRDAPPPSSRVDAAVEPRRNPSDARVRRVDAADDLYENRVSK